VGNEHSVGCIPYYGDKPQDIGPRYHIAPIFGYFLWTLVSVLINLTVVLLELQPRKKFNPWGRLRFMDNLQLPTIDPLS
jgi:hypothetical protein